MGQWSKKRALRRKPSRISALTENVSQWHTSRQLNSKNPSKRQKAIRQTAYGDLKALVKIAQNDPSSQARQDALERALFLCTMWHEKLNTSDIEECLSLLSEERLHEYILAEWRCYGNPNPGGMLALWKVKDPKALLEKAALCDMRNAYSDALWKRVQDQKAWELAIAKSPNMATETILQKMSDTAALRAIAITPEIGDHLRIQAARKITNPEALTEIALREGHRILSVDERSQGLWQTAVQQLTDPMDLARLYCALAEKGMGDYSRRVLLRIENVAALVYAKEYLISHGKAWYGNAIEERMAKLRAERLELTDDPDDLAQALQDPALGVRLVAVEKCKDPTLLREVALARDEYDAVKAVAIRSLTHLEDVGAAYSSLNLDSAYEQSLEASLERMIALSGLQKEVPAASTLVKCIQTALKHNKETWHKHIDILISVARKHPELLLPIRGPLKKSIEKFDYQNYFEVGHGDDVWFAYGELEHLGCPFPYLDGK